MLDPRRLQAELSDLMADIGVPPDWQPEGAGEAEADSLAESDAASEDSEAGQGGDVAANIETAIDLLRLWVKYLLLDLEATRRESDSLRKMLQRRQEEQES